MDKKTAIILIVLVLLVATIMYFLNLDIYKLHLYFYNAGKADSCLVTFDGKNILIDTGEEDFFDKLDKSLEEKKVKKIDYLIITHFDKDHVGSAAKIINKYEIGNVYQTNTTKNSEYYSNYLKALDDKNITPITVENDLTINIDKLVLIINGPNKKYTEDESNNSSLIVSIKYKNKSYLLLGDAQDKRLEDYLSDHTSKYDVIKLPYHGHYQEMDKKLLEVTKPKEIIISSNKIDDELEALIKDEKIKYYITEDGSIDIASGYFYKINIYN